jgi:aspartyl protease family protein
MSPSFLFQVAVLIAASVGGTYYLAGNMDVKDTIELKDTATETQAINPRQEAALSQGSVVSIPRTNGQFFAQGRVNNGSVRFLVDTGASTVALTLEDARKSGININSLVYNRPVATANGRVMAAEAMLKDVRIGGVRVTNVRALVLSEGLHISLLGMTYLGELQKVEVMPNQLILRR